MRLFIDCEFNGFGGELISMALVAEDGQEFYEVLECKNPVPWVEENVMPILGKEPVSIEQLQYRLANFLLKFDEIHVIADWPEDLMWFCRTVIVGPGQRMGLPPLTLELIPVNAPSELPHNALADARGIARTILQKQRSKKSEELHNPFLDDPSSPWV